MLTVVAIFSKNRSYTLVFKQKYVFYITISYMRIICDQEVVIWDSEYF